MSTKGAFSGIEPVRYQGPDAQGTLCYRYYDKDRVVRGKRMEEQLRLAVCYWHTFCWDGSDMFGSGSFDRPWHRGSDPIAQARSKAEAAFELFEKLGVRYFCFHDRDVAPEGNTLAESNKLFDEVAKALKEGQQKTGVKLLWGTANLFSVALL